MNSWPKLKNKFMLTNHNFYILNKSSDPAILKKNTLPNLFFFGRYMKYKNIEFIRLLALKMKDISFVIYSYECKLEELPNLKIHNGWVPNSDINNIYLENDILILPYNDATQSGPLYLGLEMNKIIILSDIDEFKIYSDNINVHFYKNNCIESAVSVIRNSIERYTKLTAS
jgi:hypothetical protein